MDMELLRKVDLFAGLETLHLAHIASIAQEEEHRKNVVLFEDGEKGSKLFVVASGSVRISKMVPGIGEEALAVLKPGAYFGEMEFIDRTLRRAAQATIHSRCTLYKFPYEELDMLLGTDRDMALAISNSMLKTLSRRLRATNEKVTAMFAMAQFT